MMITPNLPAAVAQPATASTSSSDPGGVSDLFLKLLASQLKSQSPLDPVDPTQFVGQLIQFNSLSQLMQIRQLLGSKTSSAVPANPLPNTSATSIQGAH
jgi:flagellar basal-body rod modification protein FlgD